MKFLNDNTPFSCEIYESGKILLQYSSGTDLALLLIDVLNTAKTPVSEDNTGMYINKYTYFPKATLSHKSYLPETFEQSFYIHTFTQTIT
jgi:hypothetical protein